LKIPHYKDTQVPAISFTFPFYITEHHINEKMYQYSQKLLSFLFLEATGFNMENVLQSTFKLINNTIEESWVCISQFVQSFP
jgi:hypothetical protein